MEALRVLVANLRHSEHRFLADDVGFAPLVEPLAGQLVGHRQVTDLHLLGLALRHSAKLATLDKGVGAMLPSDKAFQGTVELIATADGGFTEGYGAAAGSTCLGKRPAWIAFDAGGGASMRPRHTCLGKR